MAKIAVGRDKCSSCEGGERLIRFQAAKKKTPMTIIHELRPRSFRFRWAACQIDILGRLHSVCDIRKALQELPETLDETYERILMKIPQKSSRLAHKVLQLLAFDDEKLFSTLNALAEAVVVDVEQLSFSSEKRLFDKNDVF